MDEKDPGFFGFGFDFNNDGNLDDGERINDTAQFMDTSEVVMKKTKTKMTTVASEGLGLMLISGSGRL